MQEPLAEVVCRPENCDGDRYDEQSGHVRAYQLWPTFAISSPQKSITLAVIMSIDTADPIVK